MKNMGDNNNMNEPKDKFNKGPTQGLTTSKKYNNMLPTCSAVSNQETMLEGGGGGITCGGANDTSTRIESSSPPSQTAPTLDEPTTSNPGELRENESTTQTQTLSQKNASTLPSLTSSITRVSTAASASSKDIILATVASAEKSTNSAVPDAAAENDVLGTYFAASSMKRSFDKLSKIDLSVDCANYQAPDYLFGFGGSHGGGLWGPKESTQEEIDGLISFANKYIIRGRGERGYVGENVQEDCASKGAARGERDAGDDDVKIDDLSKRAALEKDANC